MPGRSPPWTVSTQGEPPVGGLGSAGTSATVTRSDRSMVSEASAPSMSRTSASPAQTSIIAKCPRSRVIVESSRLSPSSASRAVVSAMMPGRSRPTTVTA